TALETAAGTDDTTLTFIVVEDSQTKKGEGLDILVNVEKIRFADMEFNAAVVQEVDGWAWPAPEIRWKGTFGDDIINFNEFDDSVLTGGRTQSEYSDINWDGTSDPLNNDRMYGESGDDVLIAGAGGDRLNGGVGNDILDGGANGSVSFEWDEWMEKDVNYDVAEYDANIDRFELNKFTFVGKNMAIKDQDDNTVFTITAETKGSDTIGKITRAGSDKVVYQIDEGETFYSVSDSLPESYGGYGTDILLGMETARFGYEWDGNVEFQVDYRIDSWTDWNTGQVNGQVNADGTRFDDVIDLRAGKTADQGGFGGFNDFNTGMDIWDEGFVDAQDDKFSADETGFDIWNWAPGEGDTAEATDQSVMDYSGNTVPGSYDIYAVTVGQDANGDDIVKKVAWAVDVDHGFVWGEVSTDGSTWTEDYGDDFTFDPNATGANDIYGWQPDGETAIATEVQVEWDDGFTEKELFTIYNAGSADAPEYVAYNAEWGFVFEAVNWNDTEGSWVVTHVEGLKEFEDDDFDWGWLPGENDTATGTATKIYWDEEGGDVEVSGTWEIYAFDGDHYAYNTEWDFLDSKVMWNSTANKYYFVDDFDDIIETTQLPSNSSD
ncbi:MAG: hypothetical protein GY905_12180, partial [Gammaproteobacteria bacterium]|nr:hypothetical protein [Gammaproteobacteria bacterium]